jgi:phosphoribosylaminoimidazole-succinocarboxamide synthase
MGSVKEVDIIKAATGSSEGLGTFSFSDRYSVFDWGEMPDHIDQKGSALCTLSSYFFNLLSKKRIRSHFVGLIGPDGNEINYEKAKVPANKMKVKVVRVIKPVYIKEKNIYDYSGYAGIKNNFLVPLEVIYRNSLPEGSSVFKRLKNKSTTLVLIMNHNPEKNF